MPTLEERILEYDTHRDAGYAYYNSIRAQLSLNLEADALSLQAVLDIQHKMEPVKNELIWGDWKNALSRIDEVTPNEHLTPAFIAQIKSDIETYITDNYSW